MSLFGAMAEFQKQNRSSSHCESLFADLGEPELEFDSRRSTSDKETLLVSQWPKASGNALQRNVRS